MLVIRLRRTGQRNQATFSIVVAEKSAAVKGKFLELVGSYGVALKPKTFAFNKDRIEYWISKGARPSDTVAALLKKEGMKDMEKFIEPRTKKRRKKGEEPAAPAPATPVEQAPVADTPAVEATPSPESAEEPAAS